MGPCGPLVNYSQFWVERFIGFVKNLLRGTNLAAESMNETAKMTERVKIYFGDHFARRESGDLVSQADDNIDSEGWGITLLFPSAQGSLNGSYLAQKKPAKFWSATFFGHKGWTRGRLLMLSVEMM